MNEIVFKTLKEKDFIVKNYLFRVATELHLSLNEMILIIYLINQEEPALNIENIKSCVYLTEEEILEAFNRLIGINLISVNIVKLEDGSRNEVISLDNIIKFATSDITKQHKNDEKDNLFETFEKEFGRTLSPIEMQIIDDWLKQGINEELIIEALKEAVYNGACSLKYISKILLTWQERGYKNKSDVHIGIKKESEDNMLTDLFDYDWLNEK